jgi:hypothetical protein
MLLQESSQHLDSLALRTGCFRTVCSVALRTQGYEYLEAREISRCQGDLVPTFIRISCTSEGHLPQGAASIKDTSSVVEDLFYTLPTSSFKIAVCYFLVVHHIEPSFTCEVPLDDPKHLVKAFHHVTSRHSFK